MNAHFEMIGWIFRGYKACLALGFKTVVDRMSNGLLFGALNDMVFIASSIVEVSHHSYENSFGYIHHAITFTFAVVICGISSCQK